MLALVAADRFGGSNEAIRLGPSSRRMRLTLVGEMLTSAAICWPVHH
ncbi:hypothetical protein X740_16665 [Mesorhizobium sp. LNHC221B00]|nr:hypothetical protein X740_16665 [Mesorhizobium sp. LNHC221B00]